MNRLGLLKRITELRIQRGIASERALGLKAGVGPDFLRHIRIGKSRAPGADKLAKVAAALDTTLDDLLAAGKMKPPAPFFADFVQVVGEVQAGAWREAFSWPRNQQFALSLPPDPRWPRAERFGLALLGDSMNKLYPHRGTIVICARYDQIGEAPAHDDIVVVQRYRAGLVEATCKVLCIRPDGSIWLEPRSTDPAYKAFRLPKGSLETPEDAPDSLPAVVHGGPVEDIPQDLDEIYITARVTSVWAPQ